MAQVTLTDVNKVYPSRHGPVHAVEDLNLTVEDGEFVALLGPSGCGKTSTLRMIVGLEAITSGTVAFDGQPMNDLSPEQRNVAMAFETYALYPTFTIADNLGFPLDVRNVDKVERKRRIDAVAKMLRIEHLLGSRPRQLSGGEQQRVSLGRALIREPAAFILDEVMSHLDAHLKFQMLFELRRIHQSVGRTTIYVTHDQMEALALSDRVAVMSNARLQQFGTRDELYDRPANRFVADFIGEPPTNFLEAQVDGADGAMALAVDGTDLRFQPDPERLAAIRRDGLKRVSIGIRPQNISVHPGPDKAALTARVVLDEFLGEQSIVTVASGDAQIRLTAPPEFQVAPGEDVTFHYRPSDVMVFDPQTEVFVA